MCHHAKEPTQIERIWANREDLVIIIRTNRVDEHPTAIDHVDSNNKTDSSIWDKWHAASANEQYSGSRSNENMEEESISEE